MKVQNLTFRTPWVLKKISPDRIKLKSMTNQMMV